MSIDQVQARTAEIASRIALLRQGAPLSLAGTGAVRGVLGGTPVLDAGQTATAQSFAAVLASAQAPAPAAAGSTRADTAAKVLASAREHLGTPYVWGGEDPGGFDCSGLVQFAYGKHGVDLPRVSVDQARAGREVPVAQAEPGDLVFFGEPVDHVGIYAGGGRMVVAPRRGEVVREQDVNFAKVTHVRRVLPEGSTPVPAVGSSSAALSSSPLSSAGSGPSSASGWQSRVPAAARPYLGEIEKAAAQAGVAPELVAAVAWTESNFNPRATSPVGAQGLMQIMPATARGLGVDATDPSQALRGGATYLAQQLKTFGGRTDLALAAYNAGPGAVRKHGGIPPYSETQAYVRRVLDRMSTLGGAA